MAPLTSTSGNETLQFTWKEITSNPVFKVELLICRAGGINDDCFKDENNPKLDIHLLEKKENEFTKNLSLETGTFQFLFRINDNKENLLTSALYQKTYLSSGREVNFLEVGINDYSHPPRSKFPGDMFDTKTYIEHNWNDENTPLLGTKRKKKMCCGGNNDEQCCCVIV